MASRDVEPPELYVETATGNPEWFERMDAERRARHLWADALTQALEFWQAAPRWAKRSQGITDEGLEWAEYWVVDNPGYFYGWTEQKILSSVLNPDDLRVVLLTALKLQAGKFEWNYSGNHVALYGPAPRFEAAAALRYPDVADRPGCATILRQRRLPSGRPRRRTSRITRGSPSDDPHEPADPLACPRCGGQWVPVGLQRFCATCWANTVLLLEQRTAA
jgi:hypothetical protein